jgi:hypothetical protein
VHLYPSSGYPTASPPFRHPKKKDKFTPMKTNSLFLCFSLFLGCGLLADGTIDETCEDFSTCGAISNGGVFFVKKKNDSSDWRVSLRNGLGEEIEYWDGQGSSLGGVAYEASENTVYLSEGNNIRVLQSDGTPKITDQGFFPGATLSSSSAEVVFGNNDYLLTVDADLTTTNIYNSNNVDLVPGFLAILQTANLATKFEDGLVAVLFLAQNKPGFVEINREGITEQVIERFDSSPNRAKDAFLMNGEYATCAETGATFLVNELVNENATPDRYPLISLGNIVSCEYDSSTDQVVLFSALNGVGFMDANGDIVRILDPTEGHHIVNGSIW